MLWLISEVVIGLRYRAPAGARRQDRGSQLAVIAGYVIGIWTAVAIAYCFPDATIQWHPHVVAILSVSLMVAGIAFRGYAIRVLGRFFTVAVVTRPGQPVVEHGPYRLIRHPSYTGSLLTFLGMCLALTNWLAVTAILLPLAGVSYRIRVEEGALLQSLGEPYEAYMRRTKRLVPYLI